LQGAYFVKSRHIKQSKLHAPPFEQTGQHLTFIATEREVFGQDVSVALFEFPYQPAFRAVSATEQRARAYMRATLEDGQVALLVWSGGEWMAEGLDN